MTAEEPGYPIELDQAITLLDGSRLRIRALRRSEDGPVRDLYAHLSLATRYQRFFSPLPTLPDDLLRLLTCVDHRHRLALVAEHQNGNDCEVVGLGSFAAVGERTAEVALVVRDDWQQRSVGTALASRVLQAAEERGYDRFVVHALWQNIPIRKILRRVGEVMATTMRGGVSEIVFVRQRPPLVGAESVPPGSCAGP